MLSSFRPRASASTPSTTYRSGRRPQRCHPLRLSDEHVGDFVVDRISELGRRSLRCLRRCAPGRLARMGRSARPSPLAASPLPPLLILLLPRSIRRRGGAELIGRRQSVRSSAWRHISLRWVASASNVLIEGVVPGQVFVNRRTSLRAESSSQVFIGSRTASKDKSPGHRPEGNKSAGPTFKTGVGARAPRRVRFPSASAWRTRGEIGEPFTDSSSPPRELKIGYCVGTRLPTHLSS